MIKERIRRIKKDLTSIKKMEAVDGRVIITNQNVNLPASIEPSVKPIYLGGVSRGFIFQRSLPLPPN